MNAVCIVVDGLRCGFLGCYGNTWVQTPAIDRLAAQGFVFDQALIESPQWDDAYRSYWLGESGFAPREKELASLPHTLATAGVNTALVTDEAELAVHPLAASLGEIVQLPIARQQAAASIDETQFAAVFTAAADWIDSAQEPFLLWVHAQGMHAAWDAPQSLRQALAEEDGMPAPDFILPPCAWHTEAADPDELLALRWAYAAQISVLDRCLDAFLEWFEAQPAARDTMVLLLGARGYPLGEHARVGMAEIPADGTSLHEELVHVPTILRLPNGLAAGDRSQSLTLPSDIFAALAAWFQLAEHRGSSGGDLLSMLRASESQARSVICQRTAAGERAVRTVAWHLIMPASETSPQLYVKPDDRWEKNDIASRCGDVADLLAHLLATYEQSGGMLPAESQPLPDVLTHGLV